MMPEDEIRLGGSEGLLGLKPNSSISIKYDQSFGSHEDLKLLEVDETILKEVLDKGVTIRGHPDEEAVLCTSSTTYAIKYVSTSNSVFIIPPQSFVSEESPQNGTDEPTAGAIKLASGHMELSKIAPKLEKLKFLLRQRPYREDTETETETGIEGLEGLYKWEDLLENVQASEEELREGLNAVAALEIEGYWRIVDEKFMGCLLDVLILNSVHHDWSLNALRTAEILPVLERDGYSDRIILHCLQIYGNRVDSGTGAGENGQGNGVWAINESLVCLHYAKQLMNAGKWKLDDFMEAWAQNLPPGMQASMEILKGEALVEKFGADMWIRPFSVSSLPATPAERFAAIFRERPRWEWQDLEPYIRDLRVPGLSAEGLLIKYTRKTQPTADAAPIFSAR
eukprot:Gb_37493 [translate_table: standard]